MSEGGRGEAIASGSNGPFLPPQSIPQPNEPNGSRGSQQTTMSVGELMHEFRERIVATERWMAGMVRNGMVFKVGPADRTRVGAGVRIEGCFVSGEFKLNWNRILSPEQRAGANYSFGSGDDSWRRHLSRSGPTEITIVRETRDRDTGREIQSSRVHANGDNRDQLNETEDPS